MEHQNQQNLTHKPLSMMEDVQHVFSYVECRFFADGTYM